MSESQNVTIFISSAKTIEIDTPSYLTYDRYIAKSQNYSNPVAKNLTVTLCRQHTLQIYVWKVAITNIHIRIFMFTIYEFHVTLFCECCCESGGVRISIQNI